MAHITEITSIDNQIPLLLQTKKDEIEERRKVDHIIEIKETNGQDLLGSQTKKSLNQIFDEMFENLDNLSIKSRSIFKVSVGLRESNQDAYTPKMVSIGPYHNKNPQLVPMEKYKLLYLRRFLQRKEGLDVESCITELQKLKEEALLCYEDIVEDDDSHGFCQMLLLDGCFVVEFIRECCDICPEGEDKIINIDDCIYSLIFRDLMLLENQLPFFVLNKLHDMTKQVDEFPLTTLVNYSFIILGNLPNMFRASINRDIECNAGKIKHLLHAVHLFLCHGNPMKKSNDGITKLMPNATELSESGVSFVTDGYCYSLLGEDKIGDNISLFDIKFENGLMTIPCFEVEDDTETILRNLIAYEQQTCDVQPKYFSDFTTFMDYLIDSDKDVNLLRQKGIIVNWLGEDKEVVTLFNKLGNGVGVYPNFYYKEEFKRAAEHYEKPWNRMKANLRHKYFNTPWAGLSTGAAIVLLLLTIIQTILSFISLFK